MKIMAKKGPRAPPPIKKMTMKLVIMTSLLSENRVAFVMVRITHFLFSIYIYLLYILCL